MISRRAAWGARLTCRNWNRSCAVAAEGAMRRTIVTAKTVTVRVVDHLVAVGVAEGIRRDTLTGAAGVTDEDLRDPDARVPLAAEIALWQTLARHVSNPEFGVRAGAAHSLRTMGLLGYVARFRATLRGALRRVQRYGGLFTESVEFGLPDGEVSDLA